MQILWKKNQTFFWLCVMTCKSFLAVLKTSCSHIWLVWWSDTQCKPHVTWEANPQAELQVQLPWLVWPTYKVYFKPPEHHEKKKATRGMLQHHVINQMFMSVILQKPVILLNPSKKLILPSFLSPLNTSDFCWCKQVLLPKNSQWGKCRKK